MIIEHDGKSPQIDKDAYIAPDATLCGDVRIAAGARIMHGARLIAEGGTIEIGRESIVMQNAVMRAIATQNCRVGANVLVGPTAHVVGATVDDQVFLATGCSIFHGSHIGSRSVVRINAVVHVNTILPPETTVPIGWVAVGAPAQLFSADQHDELSKVLASMGFSQTAYGIDQPVSTNLIAVTRTLSDRLAGHALDTVLSN